MKISEMWKTSEIFKRDIAETKTDLGNFLIWTHLKSNYQENKGNTSLVFCAITKIFLILVTGVICDTKI